MAMRNGNPLLAGHRRSSTSIGPLQVAIIVAALFTAGVHLYLVVTPHPIMANLRHLFLLAAIGYLGSLAALYLPLAFLEPLRWLARLGLLATTVATIVGYFIAVGFVFSPLSLIDKLVEAVLVALLVRDTVIAYRSSETARTFGGEHINRKTATKEAVMANGGSKKGWFVSIGALAIIVIAVVAVLAMSHGGSAATHAPVTSPGMSSPVAGSSSGGGGSWA